MKLQNLEQGIQQKGDMTMFEKYLQTFLLCVEVKDPVNNKVYIIRRHIFTVCRIEEYQGTMLFVCEEKILESLLF